MTVWFEDIPKRSDVEARKREREKRRKELEIKSRTKIAEDVQEDAASEATAKKMPALRKRRKR